MLCPSAYIPCSDRQVITDWKGKESGEQVESAGCWQSLAWNWSQREIQFCTKNPLRIASVSSRLPQLQKVCMDDTSLSGNTCQLPTKNLKSATKRRNSAFKVKAASFEMCWFQWQCGDHWLVCRLYDWGCKCSYIKKILPFTRYKVNINNLQLLSYFPRGCRTGWISTFDLFFTIEILPVAILRFIQADIR